MAKTFEYCIADFLRMLTVGAEPEDVLPDGWTPRKTYLAAAGGLDDFAELKRELQHINNLLTAYRSHQSDEILEILSEKLKKLSQDERFQLRSFEEVDAESEEGS